MNQSAKVAAEKLKNVKDNDNRKKSIPSYDEKEYSVGSISIEINGKFLDFEFPETGNARKHLESILSGKDYNLLDEPDYNPHTIVDIGANVGATAIFLSKTYPSAKIFCFEPAEINYDYLIKNTKDLTNIVSFDYGLGNSDEKVKLFAGRSQCLQYSMYSSLEVTEKSENIQIKEAKKVFETLNIKPSILKIDTEGNEVPILKNIFDFLPQIDIIYLEYHSENDRLEIDSLLSSNFYLWRGNTITVHRGNLAYVSKKIVQRFPNLTKWEIKGISKMSKSK